MYIKSRERKVENWRFVYLWWYYTNECDNEHLKVRQYLQRIRRQKNYKRQYVGLAGQISSVTSSAYYCHTAVCGRWCLILSYYGCNNYYCHTVVVRVMIIIVILWLWEWWLLLSYCGCDDYYCHTVVVSDNYCHSVVVMIITDILLLWEWWLILLLLEWILLLSHYCKSNDYYCHTIVVRVKIITVTLLL